MRRKILPLTDVTAIYATNWKLQLPTKWPAKGNNHL